MTGVKKISELPILSELTSDDYYVIVDNTGTKTYRSTIESGVTFLTSSTLNNLSVVELSSSNVSASTVSADIINVDVINARVYNSEQINATTLFESGSSQFGNTLDDTHIFTGSLYLSGGSLHGDGSGVTIGSADYSDGLFVTFNENTLLPSVIDKFNEVLKGLAPQPAPFLTNLETDTYSSLNSVSETMKLSFASSSPVVGYTNVIAGLSGLPNVDTLGGSFTVTNGDSGSEKKRLGVFAQKQNIVLRLNENTVEDSQNGNINYVNDAFDASEETPELYELFLNNVLVGSITIPDSNSASNTYFNISAKSNGMFKASGLTFALFKHRTGTVTLPSTETWRNGHNYVVVKRTSGTTVQTTTYVDWVYDPALVGSYTFTPSFSSFTPTGVKWLSGIAYYTGMSYSLNATVSNYYSTTYPATSTGGMSISVDSAYAASAIGTPAAPASSTQSLVFSNTISATSTSLRLLGTAPANPSLRINSGISGGRDTTNALSLTTETILLDRVNTANAVNIENFCLENYRLISGSYDLLSDVTNPANEFSSTSNLTSTKELIFYNGALRYPTKAVNSGNISGATSIKWKGAGTQPNYSTVTGEKQFFRKFQNNGTATLAEIPLQVLSSGVTYVTEATSFTNNSGQVKISFRLPGQTNWIDLLIPDNNTDGGYSGASLASGTTTNIKTPQGSSVAQNGYILLRVTACQGWSGSISKMQMTF